MCVCARVLSFNNLFTVYKRNLPI